MSLVTVVAKREKFEGAGFVAERDTSRMSRKSWLSLRHTGIGGSDMASLIFPDDHSGPLTVYIEKVDRPAPRDDEGDDFSDFGTGMEITIRNTFLPSYLVRKCGLSLADFRIYVSPWFYRSTVSPWRTANIDGMIEFLVDVTLPNGTVIPKGLYVLEIKTADVSQREKWAGESTPDRYFAQAQHYSGMMAPPGSIVFAMVNRTPELRFLPNHDEFQDLIVMTGDAMWKRIEDRNPPPAFGGDADLWAVRNLYPEAGKEMVPFIGLEQLAADLVAARKKKKEAANEVKFYEAQIKSAIGNAGGLVDSTSRATWSRWPSMKFDEAVFKAAHPALYERFKTKEVPGNRLTVTVRGVVSDE